MRRAVQQMAVLAMARRAGWIAPVPISTVGIKITCMSTGYIPSPHLPLPTASLPLPSPTPPPPPHGCFSSHGALSLCKMRLGGCAPRRTRYTSRAVSVSPGGRRPATDTAPGTVKLAGMCKEALSAECCRSIGCCGVTACRCSLLVSPVRWHAPRRTGRAAPCARPCRPPSSPGPPCSCLRAAHTPKLSLQ